MYTKVFFVCLFCFGFWATPIIPFANGAIPPHLVNMRSVIKDTICVSAPPVMQGKSSLSVRMAQPMAFEGVGTPDNPIRPIGTEENAMMGKITFICDGRSAGGGDMYMAASFYFTIGLSNWSAIPMCNIGGGLWSLSFANVPPGAYQYKFLDGPAGWEFNGGVGGPCTNPADNNNRFVTITGGSDIEGPWCYNACDPFCGGPTAGSDNTPPTIDDPVPADMDVECGDLVPGAPALAASDGCDVNATTTTGPPTQTVADGPCGSQIIRRVWSVTDCAGNVTTADQTITVADLTPPVMTAPTPANVTINCGSLPAPAARPASDACDPTVIRSMLPVDVTVNMGPCGQRTIRRTWTARDCSGNTSTVAQTFFITDTQAPTITGTVPPDVTVSCGAVPTGAPLAATDACDATVTATATPTDNNSGLNTCGVGVLIRTWRATDCAGNSATRTQRITIQDTAPPVLNIPANTTVACGSAIPPVMPGMAVATDNCGTPTVVFVGESTTGMGCPTQMLRTWRATDCTGNSTVATQTIVVQNTVAPTLSPPPADTTICSGNVPPMIALTWTEQCGATGTVIGTDQVNGQTIMRTWRHTDACGNSAVRGQVIIVLPPPVANAGMPQTLTCGNPTATLGATAVAGFSYQWSGPGINESNQNSAMPTVNQPGVYSLTVTPTGGSGCSSVGSVTVSSTAGLPTANAGADKILTCATTNVGLDGSGTGNFAWAGPGITPANANQATPTVSASGQYILTVTNPANGCFKTDTVFVARDTAQPVARAGRDSSITCAHGVTLNGRTSTSGQGITYQWVAPNGNLLGDSLTQPALLPGLYVLRVVNNKNGCIATDTVAVIQNTTPPNSSAGPDQRLTCATRSVVLQGSGNAGGQVRFLWTGPSIDATNASFPTPTVSMTGQYVLSVENTINGCINRDTVVVAQDTVRPLAQAGPNQVLTCTALVVTLAGNGSSTGTAIDYQWVGPNKSPLGTAISQTANAVGVYTLIVLNTSNGCADTASVEVAQDIASPIVNAGTDKQLDCSVTIVSLDGSGTGNPQWTGPGINAANDNLLNPNVGAPGTYILTLTNPSNGCQASDTVLVQRDANLPAADAGNDQQITCRTPSATLGGGQTSMGGQYTYQWTDSNNTILGNNPTLDVSNAGTYTLTVINTQTGCSATDAASISENKILPTVNAGADKRLTCTVKSVTLDGNSVGVWNGPDINASNMGLVQPTVALPGIYTLTLVNPVNGCTGTDAVSVTMDTLPPLAKADSALTLTCIDPIVLLDGTESATGPQISYRWTSPTGALVGTTITAAAGVIGRYTLTVRNSQNGCTNTATTLVTEDKVTPVANAGPDKQLDCVTSSVTLEGGGFGNALWTGPGITLPNALNLQLQTNKEGWYILLLVNSLNGCIDIDSVLVIKNTKPPKTEAGPDKTLTCAADSVALDGSQSATGANITYVWSDATGDTVGTTINPTVSAVGTYTLWILDIQNGCTATDMVAVNEDKTLPAPNAGPDRLLTCATKQVLLQGSGTGDVRWEGPSIVPNQNNLATQSIGLPGIYSMTLTNPANGCSATDTTVVTQDTLAPFADAGPNQVITCTNPEATLDGGGSVSGSMFTYRWETLGGTLLGTGLSQKVSDTGTYRLTVRNADNGCTATAEASVSENKTPPDVQAGPDRRLTCSIVSVLLEGGSNGNFSWQGPGITASNATQATPTVNMPGGYILTATNPANGCTKSDTTAVALDNTPPKANAGPNRVLTCTVNAVSLDGTNSDAGAQIQYTWGNAGATILGNAPTLAATSTGTYILRVFNTSNECFALDTAEVTENKTAPTANAGSNKRLDCIAVTATLEGSGLGNPTWSGPGITPANAQQQQPVINQPGQYVLQLTDPVNGCTATDTVTITRETTPPIVNAGPNQTITCAAPNATLDGSASPSGTNLAFQWKTSNGTALGNIPTQTATMSGLYILTIRNTQTGCFASDSVLVLEDKTPPHVNAGPDQTLNCKTTSVTLTGAGSGNFNWAGPGITPASATLAAPTVSAPGIYTLALTSTRNGCSAMDTVQVRADVQPPRAEAGPDLLLTCKNDNVTLTGTNSSIGATITYQWSASGGALLGNAITQSASKPGVYILFVQNSSNGCSATDSATVRENKVFPIANAGPDRILACQTTSVVLEGSGNGNFQWAGPGIAASIAQLEQPPVTQPGTYILTLTSPANGCVDSDTVVVKRADETPIALDLAISVPFCRGDSLPNLRINRAVGQNPPFLFALGNGSFTGTTFFDSLKAGRYTLRIRDAAGCEQDTVLTIAASKNCKANLYVPSAFRPESALGNEGFTIFGDATVRSILTLQVFDRWGTLVFSKQDFPPNDPGEGWDGHYRGRPLDNGVYVYWAEVELGNGNVERISGEVALVR